MAAELALGRDFVGKVQHDGECRMNDKQFKKFKAFLVRRGQIVVDRHAEGAENDHEIWTNMRSTRQSFAMS
jgi:hypothetical protein